MRSIDLNCDMGESFGRWALGADEEVMKHITSANVACGWHAGDPMVMDRTVSLAKRHGVGVGAHPGYPDLMGFGRRRLECAPAELRNYVLYQIGALDAFCKAHGVSMTHVKPHGKLYLDSFDHEDQAAAIAEAVVSYDPNLLYVAFAGAKGRLMTKVAHDAGLKVVYEAFPDRAYTPDGNLLSRSLPGAVLHDHQEATERAVRLAKDSKMVAIDGTVIDLEAQTLCVHGDTPIALKLVQSIRSALESAGIQVAPMSTVAAG
ncbi:MAG: LamB/YcsF family protein [Deltaproteobacteria bacterium]|nr:LamB/YcsF family protein [Deltaproteobacteria bacterium]